jgi:uracil-DNA glycosylase
MEDRAKADLASEIASAIDWWRDAGVDCDFGDEPTRWLKAEEKPATAAERRAATAPSPIPPAPDPGIDRSAWPRDLAAFTPWWLTDPALDDGRTSGRVPPRGRQGAELMVIVPDPEREDAAGDTARLLSGPQGRLIDAMLAAMGFAPEASYVASILPRHMPMADWSALADKGFGALLCHHIRLVAPQRIIALGSNILPLLGHDTAHSPAVLREFNQDGVTIPLLAGKSLSALLERPRWKSGLWQGWLDWTR